MTDPAASFGAYSPEVLAYFGALKNGGGFPPEALDVGRGEAGEEASGKLVRLALRGHSDGIILEARFRAFGCPATIACASLATERVRGVPLDQAARMAAGGAEQLARALRLAPTQWNAAEVVLAALGAAVDDLERKLR